PPKTPAAAPKPVTIKKMNHPHAIMWKLEAWMTEQIAAIKLRGFLSDIGGEVIESQPGFIRMRLKRTKVVTPEPSSGFLSKLSLGKQAKPVEEVDMVPMDVYLEKADSGKPGVLVITVQLRPGNLGLMGMPQDWYGWGERKLKDLGAYLMA